jgi:hypothetical protein
MAQTFNITQQSSSIPTDAEIKGYANRSDGKETLTNLKAALEAYLNQSTKLSAPLNKDNPAISAAGRFLNLFNPAGIFNGNYTNAGGYTIKEDGTVRLGADGTYPQSVRRAAAALTTVNKLLIVKEKEEAEQTRQLEGVQGTTNATEQEMRYNALSDDLKIQYIINNFRHNEPPDYIQNDLFKKNGALLRKLAEKVKGL